MRTGLLMIILALPAISAGQVIDGYMTSRNLHDILNPTPEISRNRAGGAAYGTIGSPLVFEDFVKGNIYFADKTRTDGLLINYNCHENQVLYSDGNETYSLPTKLIDYLEFQDGESSWIFKQVFLEDRKQTLFLQVLYNEGSILYKRHFREFKSAEYGGAYDSDRRYDEYIDYHDYYLSLSGSEPIHFKPKKKDLLRAMAMYETEIEEFLKKEKIRLKTDQEVIEVVRYYDSVATRSQ